MERALEVVSVLVAASAIAVVGVYLWHIYGDAVANWWAGWLERQAELDRLNRMWEVGRYG